MHSRAALDDAERAIRNGKVSLAQKILSELDEETMLCPRFAFLQAHLAYFRRKKRKAMEWAIEATNRDKSYTDAWWFQIDLMMEMEDKEKTRKSCFRILKKGELDAEMLLKIAEAVRWIGCGELDKALGQAMKNVDYDPNDFRGCMPLDEKQRYVMDLLKQSDRIGAWESSQKLDEMDEIRLWVEVLLGDDPIESAKKYSNAFGRHVFGEFIRTHADGDYEAVLQWSMDDTNFRSAYICACKMAESNNRRSRNKRIPLLKRGMEKYKESVTIAKMLYEELKKVGADQKELDEMIFLVGERVRDCEERKMAAQSTDVGKEDDVPVVDEKWIAAEKVWELRDDQDACFQGFRKLLSDDRASGAGYLFFGKYMKYTGQDEEAVMLFQKAQSLDVFDEESIDTLSRKFIETGELMKAVEVLQKMDTQISNFRSGLIFQRLDMHRRACEEFQKHLRKYENDVVTLQALAQSYLVLGQITASMNIVLKLRERGVPDRNLECQTKLALGKYINVDTNGDFGINETPIAFHVYVKHVTANLKTLRGLLRLETCGVLIQTVECHSKQYREKWSSLASVQKTMGDFFVEAFLVRQQQSDIMSAIECFKARAEIDCRPESFIDLANACAHAGQIESSRMILRRAVKAFPDSIAIWINLAVAFAKDRAYAYARHCLCVAAKFGEEFDVSTIYCFASRLSDVVHGFKSESRSLLDIAEKSNMTDPNVCKLHCCKIDPDGEILEKMLASWGQEPGREILRVILMICIKDRNLREALGFAHMYGDDQLLSLALEANGLFAEALRYARDEDSKNRLAMLVNRLNCSVNEDTADEFASGKTGLNHVAAGIAFSRIGNVNRMVSEFDLARKSMPDLTDHIECIEMACQKGKTPDLLSLRRLRSPKAYFMAMTSDSRHPRLQAAKRTMKLFGESIFTLTVYALECLKSKTDIEVLVNLAKKLYSQVPGTRSLCILIAAEMEMGNYVTASTFVSILCTSRPSYRRKLKPVIQFLASNRCRRRDIVIPVNRF